MSNDTHRPVVLITGASSGIGEALAIEFSRRGADLVLAARREDRLKAIAERVSKDGTRVVFRRCDTSLDGDLEQVVLLAESTFGKIDTVIANAGFGIEAPFEELTLEDYRRQFETNVFGVLRTLYATLDPMKKSRGRVVVIGSVLGHFAPPDASPYAMSKFAIRALCESIRLEFAPYGISVTLISPGFIASEFRKVDRMGQMIATRPETAPRALLMPTDLAARKIVRAIENRKREAIITVHGQLAVFFRYAFPRLVSVIMERARAQVQKARNPSPCNKEQGNRAE